MTGDCHIRIYEGLGVKFPWATRRTNLRLELSLYVNSSLDPYTMRELIFFPSPLLLFTASPFSHVVPSPQRIFYSFSII